MYKSIYSSLESVSQNHNKMSRDSEYICTNIIEIQRSFSQKLKGMNFLSSNIQYVYDPTDYASEPSEKYIEEYCQDTKQVLFVGMNPGPFGMCQTGVPFGDTEWVKNWLGIEGKVDKPIPECPTRPVEGFKCTKKEQSGHRFWSLFSELCHKPEKFFRHAFLYNYCPLAFMDSNGRNITPTGTKKKELESVCDHFFLKTIDVLQPQIIIGIGRYTEKRIQSIIRRRNRTNKIEVLYLKNPGRPVRNNRSWHRNTKRILDKHDLLKYFQQMENMDEDNVRFKKRGVKDVFFYRKTPMAIIYRRILSKRNYGLIKNNFTKVKTLMHFHIRLQKMLSCYILSCFLDI